MKGPSELNVGDASSWAQPLVLSLLAGLSTSLGAAWVFCIRPKDSQQSPLSHAHMAFSLSLAGSVMVTVSFVSILPESFQDESAEGEGFHMLPLSSPFFLQRCVSFGIGCLLYFLLSRCAFPEPEDLLEDTLRMTQEQEQQNEDGSISIRAGPSSSPGAAMVDEEVASVNSSRNPLSRNQSSNLRGRGPTTPPGSIAEDKVKLFQSPETDKVDRRQWSNIANCSRGTDLQTASARRAWRVTMLLFISLAVHNFPEGLAVAASTMHSQQLGITTTVAIALHNIPEGIAIAVPCLAARPNSPCLAFWLATISGLAEPLGALVALFVLGNATTEENDNSFMSMANVLAFVAGIMTTVAIIELFPEAIRHSSESWTPFILGLVVGVVIMIGSEEYLNG